ncbi:hypothetical protein IPM62_00495 [Candidatus Woesebacteria bacterium]|nr:MAG: hypothetical protein IPM62_00495 [Candidatus Woesebacteria bacterium]
MKRFLFILAILFVLPTSVYANNPTVGCPDAHINTAIGCIPVGSESAFAIFILRWGLRIAGGIALVLMAYAGIILTTAAGNPQKVQGGKELLTAAIAGLLMVIFSAFILRLVGINILGIPNLSI